MMSILSRQPLGQKHRESPRIFRSGFVYSKEKKQSCRALESLEPVTALDTVHVRVVITLSISFGEHLCLVGSCEELGSWNVETAPKFRWTHGDVWVADVELPSGSRAEFKIVHAIPSTGEHIWEYTSNRILEVPDVNEMKDGELSLIWCDESADVTVVRPVQMSSLASWDDDDESSAGPFASVLNLFAGDTPDDIPEDVIEPMPVIDEQDEESLESAEDIIKNEVEDLLESKEDIDTDMKPPSEDIPKATLADSSEGEEETTVVVDKMEPSATSTLKKAATAAGMVAAGVAGAALLSGLAVDVADTAVLGAFAVAAGSAAFGTKSSGKSENGSADLDDDAVTSQKSLSKEPGTIIAAGLAAAFDQTTGKNTKKTQDVAAEENE